MLRLCWQRFGLRPMIMTAVAVWRGSANRSRRHCSLCDCCCCCFLLLLLLLLLTVLPPIATIPTLFHSPLTRDNNKETARTYERTDGRDGFAQVRYYRFTLSD